MAEQSFTNLDFEEAKANLKNYLKSQEQFRDYNFEGSNINVLLDILAYNTFQNNFYTNMAISEMFLDSAQVKDSVVSHAKELNYLPRSRRSAQAVISMEFSPTGNPSSITIPESTKFLARCGTETFNFYTKDAYTVRPSANGAYTINNVSIFEGRYVEEYFTVDGTESQRFVLQNDTIDTTSIEVFIKENVSATAQPEWTFRTNVYDVAIDDTVFYLQPYRDNRYEITFGDNTFGKQPVSGNVIRVRYRVTNGDEANGISTFDIASDIDGISSTETTQTNAFGGSERESLESIRYFAPKSIQIQERAVTENDYAILLQNEFPEIQAVSVFGGENLDPPRFGKVVVSAYVNEEGIIRSDIKDQYRDYLMTRTSLAVEPIIQAAQFMYIDLGVTVTYNTNKTSKSDGGISALVEDVIEAYSSTNLEDFKKTLKISRLASNIDAADVSIISSLIDSTMIIEAKPTRNQSESRIINFENAIKPDVTYTDASISSYTPAVWSTSFTYQNRIVSLQDNGNGRIDLVQNINKVISIVKRDIGSVNYTTGKLTLNSLAVQDYIDVIKIYATPANRNIVSPQDRILKIRTNDLNIIVTSARE